MELVKIIFEGFGGREMERIFSNYFLLSLLLKQLLFSFFINPADNPEIFSIPVEKEQISKEQVCCDNLPLESPGESTDDVWTFQLTHTLAKLEPDRITAPNNINSNNK